MFEYQAGDGTFKDEPFQDVSNELKVVHCVDSLGVLSSAQVVLQVLGEFILPYKVSDVFSDAHPDSTTTFFAGVAVA